MSLLVCWLWTLGVSKGSFMDRTSLATDWGDIHLLLADMERFAGEHPDHVFLAADDPGYNHSPPREPRLGWVAFRQVEAGGDEGAREWTITLANFRDSFRGGADYTSRVLKLTRREGWDGT